MNIDLSRIFAAPYRLTLGLHVPFAVAWFLKQGFAVQPSLGLNLKSSCLHFLIQNDRCAPRHCVYTSLFYLFL